MWSGFSYKDQIANILDFPDHIFLFHIFFFKQPLTFVRTILSSRAVQKQVAGCIWPTGSSLLTPVRLTHLDWGLLGVGVARWAGDWWWGLGWGWDPRHGCQGPDPLPQGPGAQPPHALLSWAQGAGPPPWAAAAPARKYP